MVTFKYKGMTSTGRLIKYIFICFILLFLTMVPAEARRSDEGPLELTIYPVKAGEIEQKYQLIVKAEDQTDADAIPLYEKAVKSIPKDFNQKQIVEWLKLPVEQFPQQQAEEALQKYLEPLKLAVRASRCKECNWPEWKPGDQPMELSGYRKLAFILELWARLEISRQGYEGATIAMRTAFVTARDLGQAPTIIQGLVGAAVGGVMCREVEQFVQAKDSPNLYRALASLPRPLVDMEKAIESEQKASPGFLRKLTEKQMAPAYDRTRVISKRLTNNLNGLQCVEAIRHYAATHDGQLPENLSDISTMEIPKDVMSGKAFDYRLTSAGAVLRSVMPEGGGPKDMVHYVMVWKK